MESGLNERPFWPTVTTWTPLAGEADAMAAAEVVVELGAAGFPLPYWPRARGTEQSMNRVVRVCIVSTRGRVVIEKC
jgi:hypothetical protein